MQGKSNVREIEIPFGSFKRKKNEEDPIQTVSMMVLTWQMRTVCIMLN